MKLINADGGVLGHSFRCSSTNTQGDPADAVPAIEKMLATTSNLAGVLGPSSDEASAVVPILNSSSIPMLVITGQPSFDKTSDQYLWRTLPADDQLGYAMAAWGKLKGYSSAAAFFGNSVGGQAQVPGLVAVTGISAWSRTPTLPLPSISPPTAPRSSRSSPRIPKRSSRRY